MALRGGGQQACTTSSIAEQSTEGSAVRAQRLNETSSFPDKAGGSKRQSLLVGL